MTEPTDAAGVTPGADDAAGGVPGAESEPTSHTSANAVRAAAQRARDASRTLAMASGELRDHVLRDAADALIAAEPEILAANAADVARGRDGGLSEAMLERLTLTSERVAGIAQGLRDLATLPDPLAEQRRRVERPNGLVITERTVPFGVVGMIFESRPNVTVDAAGICLKTGNACVLRGGSAALESSKVLVAVLREALARRGLPADAVVLLTSADRGEATALMTARGLVDVIIPRGGANLIQAVVANSTVPVIETGAGNCHVYVDRAADLAKARDIIVNSKTQRTSTCNTAETLLVHRDVAAAFLPDAFRALGEKGVLVHADADALPYAKGAGCAAVAATEEDWDREYLALELAAAVVDDLDAALEHVRRHSTQHTEAIVTADPEAARRWTAAVDAAVVVVNASTRFTDGGEFGFGAEIGISTQKLHARGPMGLRELTTTKWVVEGDGQIRA